MGKVKQFIDVAANSYDALVIYKLLGDELEQDFLKKEAAIKQLPTAVLNDGDALPILETSLDPSTPRKINWGAVQVTNGSIVSIGGKPISGSGGSTQNIWETIQGNTGSIIPNSPNTVLQVLGSGSVTTSVSNNTINITGTVFDIFKTISTDYGSTSAAGSADTLFIVGEGSITTSVFGNVLTITGVGDGTDITQNLWKTVVADSGSSTAQSPNDVLRILGSGNVSTSMLNGTLTIASTADPDQNVFTTVVTDSGSIVASTPTDTINFIGDGDVTTSVSGNTVTIFGTSTPGTTQNLWQTISADTGSSVAQSPTDTLQIIGAGPISTSITNGVLTIDSIGGGTDQNVFVTFNSNSGSITATSTTDFLNIVGSGGISTSIIGNNLYINGAGVATTIVANSLSGLSVNGVDSSDDEVLTLVQNDNRLITAASSIFDYIGFWDTSISGQRKTLIKNLPGWDLKVQSNFKEEINPGDVLNITGSGLIGLSYTNGTLNIDAAERYPSYTHNPDALIAYGGKLYSYDITEGTAKELINAPEADWLQATSFEDTGVLYTTTGNTIFKYDVVADTTTSVTIGAANAIVHLENDPGSNYCYAWSPGTCFWINKTTFAYGSYGPTIVAYSTGTTMKVIDTGIVSPKRIVIYSDVNDRFYYKEVKDTYTGNDSDSFTQGCDMSDRTRGTFLNGFYKFGLFGADNFLEVPNCTDDAFACFVGDGSGGCDYTRVNDIFNVPSGRDYSGGSSDDLNIVSVSDHLWNIGTTPTSYAAINATQYSDRGIYVGNPAIDPWSTSNFFEQAVHVPVSMLSMHVEPVNGGANGSNVIVGGGGEVFFHHSAEDPKMFFQRTVKEVSSNGYDATTPGEAVTFVYFNSTYTGGGIDPTIPTILSYLDLAIDSVIVEEGAPRIDFITGNNITFTYEGSGGRVRIDATTTSSSLWEDHTGYIAPLDINNEVRIGSISGTGTDKLTVTGSTRLETTLIDGDLYITGGLKDSSGDFGTPGQLLSTTGSTTNWIDPVVPGDTSEWTRSTNLLYPVNSVITKVLIGQTTENDPYTSGILQVSGKAFIDDDLVVSGNSPTFTISNDQDASIVIGYDDVNEMSIIFRDYGYGQVTSLSSRMIVFDYDGSQFNTTIESHLKVSQKLYDSLGLEGTSGQVLSSTGTAIKWIDPPTGSSIADTWTDTGAYLTPTIPSHVEIHQDNPSLILRDTIGGSSYVGLTHYGSLQSFDLVYNGSQIFQYLDVPNLVTFFQDLETNAALHVNSYLYDSLDNFGLAGQILSSTGSGVKWMDITYTHPSYPGDDFSIDTGVLTGGVVISSVDINVTTDILGHVTDANGIVGIRTLTAADVDAATADHTHAYLPLTGGTLTGPLIVEMLSPSITIRDSNLEDGALYLGNPAHGIKRNYAGSGVNNIGMYTTSGSIYLSVSGDSDTDDFVLTSGGLSVQNSVTALDHLLSGSDIRLKENINTPNVSWTDDANIVSFNMISNPGVTCYGVIAQELQLIAPDLVRKDTNSGMLTVSYTDFLVAKVARLEERIKILEDA